MIFAVNKLFKFKYDNEFFQNKIQNLKIKYIEMINLQKRSDVLINL